MKALLITAMLGFLVCYGFGDLMVWTGLSGEKLAGICELLLLLVGSIVYWLESFANERELNIALANRNEIVRKAGGML